LANSCSIDVSSVVEKSFADECLIDLNPDPILPLRKEEDRGSRANNIYSKFIDNWLEKNDFNGKNM